MPTPATPVAIKGIGTAVPPYRIAQSDAAEAARTMFGGRFADFGRLAGVFESTGIAARHSVLPLERFFEPLDWPQRSEAYLGGASALFLAAAQKALDDAGMKASEIDSVVTISSTGIATPSLEARVSDTIGFRRTVQRVPVFGLGCAGAIQGLAIAADLARARPGRRVLLVALETCTLAFRADKLTKENVVATALFGDGAAAMVLESDAEGETMLVGEATHQWPDTLAIMGWRVDREGFGVIFDRAIPPFVAENIRPALDTILPSQPDGFVCHPGGAKVITALEEALELGDGRLAHERAILRDYGNMSSPTVLFVLERALRDTVSGQFALMALGPGFSLALAMMERA